MRCREREKLGAGTKEKGKTSFSSTNHLCTAVATGMPWNISPRVEISEDPNNGRNFSPTLDTYLQK